MKQKNNFTLTTPVLFLTFNRLDTTKQVFEEIKKAKPKQLFLASDGPRKNKPEEKKIVEEIRKYVLDNIDWKCEVKTLFREKNFGCKYAVSGAIDWFFENVEQGIILEDDVLPNQSFFRFCQEMLERYKGEEKIMSVSGYNPLGKSNINESYLFSKYFFCWGWATWRRAWKLNEFMEEKHEQVKGEKFLRDNYPSWIERKMRRKKRSDILEGRVDSWAYYFNVCHHLNKKLCVVSKFNLVRNLGLKKDSTHTKENYWDKLFLGRNYGKIHFPLINPVIISENKSYTQKYLNEQIIRIILKKISLN